MKALYACAALANILVSGAQNPVDVEMAHSKIGFASLVTNTGDDGKDKDTCVDVVVTTKDGSVQIAHITHGACPGEYKPHTNNNVLHLTVDSAIEWEQYRGFKATVTQHTVGNDTWKWCGGVDLFFERRVGGQIVKNLIRQALPIGGECTELVNNGASVQLVNRD